MTPYSNEYLQGIKDGRATRRECTTWEEIQNAAKIDLDFVERVSGLAFSGENADYLKGLKDFWNNQLKINTPN